MKRVIGAAALLIVLGGAAIGWVVAGEDPVITDPVPVTAESPFRYPIALWDRGVEGETVLMVHVTESGVVDTAYVLVSSGQAAFDSAAMAGSAELRFQPALRGDVPVAKWARLPVRFHRPSEALNRGE